MQEAQPLMGLPGLQPRLVFRNKFFKILPRAAIFASSKIGCTFLNAHKERILALFFFVLEVISVVLDQIGKDKKAYLLAAFLLSAFGFALTLYSFIEARTNPTVIAETQLKVVEIVFSLIQSIIAFVQYLLTVLKVKNDYNACAFPLAFAMIAIVFTFIKDGKSNDSSPKDWPLANFQPLGSTTSSPIKLDQIRISGSQVDSVTSIVKRSTNVGNKRGVFKLELIDDEAKKKAMEIAAGASGVDSISMNFKNKELTIQGKIDPVNLANELRTICQTELVSVQSIRDEPKKEERKPMEMKEEDKKFDKDVKPHMNVNQAYYPRKTPYYHLKTE